MAIAKKKGIQASGSELLDLLMLQGLDLGDANLGDNPDAYTYYIGPRSGSALPNDGNFIFGTAENDYLSGSEDEDIIISNGGYDWIWAGGGDDTVVANANREDYEITRIDLLQYFLWNKSESNGGWLMVRDVEHIVFADGTTLDLDLSPATTGTDGSDMLFAGDAGATIDARAGDDYILGSASADIILGGDGSDLLLGQGGGDILYGGADGDGIYVYEGDQAFGGDGNDAFTGNGGTMTGGAGNDQFLFHYNYAIMGLTDVITDFTSGEDVIQIYNYMGPENTTWSVAQEGDDAVIAAGSHTIVLKNVQAAMLAAGDIVIS